MIQTLDTKREYTVRAPAHLRVCAGVENLAALLALEAGAVPVVAQGLPPLREVDRSPALPTRPHPHTRQPLTIEQNGGASDLLVESLNPSGCAERTSELRL